MTEQNGLYVVTGATGHIGNGIAEALLEAGKRVRVVGRSADRLQDLVEKGAEAAVASLDTPAQVRDAFAGAASVFSMIPPNVTSDDVLAFGAVVSKTQVEAIRSEGVGHVVSLSSIGGHLPGGTGPIRSLHDHETRLNAVDGLRVLHLRPGFFMENFLMWIDTIKSMGVAGSPLRGDLAIPVIATQDIAQAAAAHLLALDFTGSSVRELHGERDLTMQEAAAVLGKAIGREELTYVQFPYEQAEQAMVGAGLSPSMAGLLVEMDRNFNEEVITPTETRSPDNTTATSIEAWAPVFAGAFGAE